MPMAGTSCLFAVARQRERKVQFAPDVFCEFDCFFIRGFVLSSGDNATRFRHEAIVRLKSLSGDSPSERIAGMIPDHGLA